MKTAGIVAEYNPFHNGHAYQLQKTREAGFSHIAVVMSGHFTQRGEPACLLKEARCRAALACGADLVIELPLPWAVSSAARFAKGAVSALDGLGCVEALSFGSECGDLPLLTEYARKIISLENSPALKGALGQGHSFPRARELAVGSLFGVACNSPLRSPNDLLGMEYIRALLELKSPITPLAVQRVGAGHNAEGPSGRSASASHLRGLFAAGRPDRCAPYLPARAAALYRAEFAAGRAPFRRELFEPALLSFLRRLSPADFAALPDVSEGLENRIFEAVRKAVSLEELYRAVKSKRYTLSRIRRVILSAFLGLAREDVRRPVPYLRVLGFNGRGMEILRAAKASGTLPVVSRCAQIGRLGPAAARVFALECRASDLYSLCLPSPLPCGTEQRFRPVLGPEISDERLKN